MPDTTHSNDQADRLQPPADADKVPDTPVIPKHTLDPTVTRDVPSSRKAVLRDMGTHIKELAVEAFLCQLLPPLDTAINFSEVMDQLRRGNQPPLRREGWSIFSQMLPKEMSDHIEDVAYEPFQDVVNAIIATKPLQREPLIAFVQTPTQSPGYSQLKLAAKPDGYVYVPLSILDDPHHPTHDTSEIFWRQIVVCAELKKSDGSTSHRNDNVTKVLGNMTQVMRDDPRRRFTYGFTLENCRMRLWYVDRSEVVVSSAFDIMQLPRLLVRFILALAYAPSLEHLGYDPTLRRDSSQLSDSNYLVDVRDNNGQVRVFRTKRLIHCAAAEALRGRATRVWEVQEASCDPHNEPRSFVLKDIWVDSTREREGHLIAQILADAARETQDGSLGEYFLSVVCHGDVYVDGRPDTTQVVDAMYDFILDLPSSGDIRANEEIHRTRTKTGTVADGTLGDNSKRIKHSQKTHYRIVFREVGKPLRLVRTLSHVYKALADVTKALCIMHSAGWVHRDISVNNIIWVDGRVKLGDLEYAKREGDISNHPIRTASDFFTPVEIAKNELIFQMTKDEDVSTQRSDAEIPLAGILRYNPLHDLESLWWTAVYFIFYRRVCSVSGAVHIKLHKKGVMVTEQTAEQLESQKDYAGRLFVTGETRSDSFKNKGTFSSNIVHVHPAVLSVAKDLERVRHILCMAFTAFENDLNHVTFANHTTRHAKLEEILRKMSRTANGISIEPYSPSPKHGLVVEKPRTQHNVHSITSTVRRRVDSTHFASDNLDNDQDGPREKRRKL